jgi:hypothetical protein
VQRVSQIVLILQRNQQNGNVASPKHSRTARAVGRETNQIVFPDVAVLPGQRGTLCLSGAGLMMPCRSQSERYQTNISQGAYVWSTFTAKLRLSRRSDTNSRIFNNVLQCSSSKIIELPSSHTAILNFLQFLGEFLNPISA